MNNYIIKCENITKIYQNGNENFSALTEINLKIENNSFVSLVGRSGSGKSTVLHILATLDEPTSGNVYIEDICVNNLSSREKCKIRNEKIGFIFQSFYLEENYSVYTNIEMPLIIAGVSKKERKLKIEQAAKKVGLKNKLKNKASNLSGGEKQRVAIARALVLDPSIIFADEPCGNLDSHNSEIVMNLLKNMVDDGKTVVLVTHNMEDAKKTHRIISLFDGMVKNDEAI